MLIAPRSCSRFSAAMPCRRILLAAIPTSLATPPRSLCTVIVIGKQLGHGRHGQRQRWRRRGPEHVRDVQDRQHVRVPAATLDVVGVHRPAGGGGDGVGEIARLVQGVGVQGHRQAGAVGDRQARVDLRGRRAPVLVHLEPAGPGLDGRFQQRRGPARPRARGTPHSAGCPPTRKSATACCRPGWRPRPRRRPCPCPRSW